MIAVIAPGLFGLAPPDGAPPAQGSKSLPGEAFAGIVAAALAAPRHGAESPSPGSGPPTPAGGAAGDADAGPPDLALLLAGALPLRLERAADPAAGTRSPDRLAEANADPGLLEADDALDALDDALASLLAQLLGGTARAEADQPETDGGVDLLAHRSFAATAVDGAEVPGVAGEAGQGAIDLAAWRGDARERIATQIDLLRAQLNATRRLEGAEAVNRTVTAPLETNDMEMDGLLAMLGDADIEAAAVRTLGERTGAGQAVAREAAQLLASTLRGGGAAEAQADVELEDIAAASRQLMTGGAPDTEGAPAVADLDLPDALAAGLPLTATPASARAEAVQAAVRVSDPALFASQFAETVESAVMRGSSEVRLVLNPPDLGHLDISVVETDQGLRIRLEASQSAARELMERQLPALQQALEARDLRIERIQVGQAAAASADDASGGRQAAGEQHAGGQGARDGSSEPEWSPVAALGLAANGEDGSASISTSTIAAPASAGVVGADGRVDVLA